MAGSAIAVLDLSVAISSHGKFFLGTSTTEYINAPRIDVAKISKRWARNLEIQTGSPKLPLLRGVGGGATLLGGLLSGWDSYRALRDGDSDAALAYGMAAVGGGLWGGYGLGLLINPYVLVAGMLLSIGGTIAANIFTDTDLELIVKKGPFGKQFAEAGLVDQATGNGQRFAHLKTPLVAYQQLLGALGQPQVFALRLADWRQKAPAVHLQALHAAFSQRSPVESDQLCVAPHLQPLADNDWALVLSSPLLSMFENDRQFQLVVQEFISSMGIGSAVAFDVKRYQRTPVGPPKLAALPLDAATVLYILPSSLESPQLSPLARQRIKMTQGLKVCIQFELSGSTSSEHLMLPQPSPKQWTPFTDAHRRVPPDNLSLDDAPPYWHIEITELPV